MRPISSNPIPWNDPKFKYPPPPPPSPPPFQAAGYTIALTGVQIVTRRTGVTPWSVDTDSGTAVATVNDGDATTQSINLGDVGSGWHDINLTFGPFQLSNPQDTLSMAYTLVNKGGGPTPELENVLNTAMKGLASMGARAAAAGVAVELGAWSVPIVASVLEKAAEWLISQLDTIVFPNCDGPVASGLFAQTAEQLWTYTHMFPNGWVLAQEHPGVNSPTGCGSNSEYVTYLEAKRV